MGEEFIVFVFGSNVYYIIGNVVWVGEKRLELDGMGLFENIF